MCQDFGSTRVVELGCGSCYLTQTLQDQGFAAIGVDISETAIHKARITNPKSIYLQCGIKDFDVLEKFDPDIFLMAEITWYVLDELDEFLNNLRSFNEKRNRPTFLIHLLTTYAPGVQKYGADKFTNLDKILAYFKLNTLESGSIRTLRPDNPLSQGTYFVAKI